MIEPTDTKKKSEKKDLLRNKKKEGKMEHEMDKPNKVLSSLGVTPHL
jgi:hypothetical protein